MTDAKWLSCTDPSPMLWHFERGTSDRKLRLFACACCRAIWPLLADERTRKLVEMIEREVDGLAGADERDVALRQAGAIAESSTWIYMTGAPADRMVTGALLAESALEMAINVARWVRQAVQDARPEGERTKDARRRRSYDGEG